MSVTVNTYNYLPRGEAAGTGRPESGIPRSDANAATDVHSDLGRMLREFRFGLCSAAGKPHRSHQVHSKGIPFGTAVMCKGWPIYFS